MGLSKIFEYSSTTEIVVKNLYWRTPWLIEWAQRKKFRKKETPKLPPPKQDFHQIERKLLEFGVKKGDILIVHSSMSHLKGTGLTPKEIILRLKNLLGETGTLVMPSIPIIENEPTGINMLDDSKYNGTFVYDVQKSPAWTGILPNELQKLPGAVRSKHPLNTLTAWGPHAVEMMKTNLDGPEPTPCGPGSSWDYCYRHRAKIVALGADLAHSLTMIHLAEDAFEELWPIKSWYRVRTFKIVDGSSETLVKVRQRRHAWSIFYAERSFSRDLFRLGIAKKDFTEGVEISYLESERLIEFLNSRKTSAYPYKIPFKRMLSKYI